TNPASSGPRRRPGRKAESPLSRRLPTTGSPRARGADSWAPMGFFQGESMSATQTIPPPGIVVRGRSFLALTLAPEWPLRAWLAGLDAQRLRAAALFEGRALVGNLARAPRGPAQPA